MDLTIAIGFSLLAVAYFTYPAIMTRGYIKKKNGEPFGFGPTFGSAAGLMFAAALLGYLGYLGWSERAFFSNHAGLKNIDVDGPLLYAYIFTCVCGACTLLACAAVHFKHVLSSGQSRT